MNILISGGTGLVGSEIGKKLATKGYKLFVLTRDKQKALLNCPFPQTPIDYSEVKTHPILNELTAIINLAGANISEKRWTSSYKKKIYDSRIQTTELLCELAESHCPKLKTFISTSAVGIYGDHGANLIHEESTLSNEFLGKLCQDWEQPVQRVKSARNVIFRIGIVFSDKGGALKEMVPPIQAGIGGALGKGTQYMSWIDIEDLTDLFTFALENEIQGVFNAVAPQPDTNKNISLEIAKHLNKSLLLNIPYFAIRALVGELALHLVESQNISSEKIRQKGFQFKFNSIKDSILKRVPQLSGLQKQFQFQQWLDLPKEEIFPFFADARNLENITPKKLNFKILSTSTPEIQEGTIINYKLKIEGIPVKWQTLIKDWQPPHFFSDNQEKGPYKKWYHQHIFEDLAGGTLMTDKIDVELPLGALGYSVASWKVLNDVNNIFNFRRQIIFDIFSKSSKVP
jgi:uncharacterized protein